MTAPAYQGGWHPGHNPWAIALTVTLATFMEVLDITIVNVALPHIAGGLAATQDEATWVLTSYLVSNAIVMPLSGWLALRIGRKRFYMSCVALFTISSFLCAIAPTLGGYLTDTVGWRWIFFLNVPVGAVSLFLTSRLLVDPPHLVEARAKRGIPIDIPGLALVALGVGSMQIMLDKGQEDDWFGSSFIRTLAVVAAVSLVLLVVRELRVDHPVVDLRLLGKRNFGLGCLLIGTVGIILFGSTVLLPQFEQALLGYSAQKAGITLSVGALCLIPIMPLVAKLANVIAARWLVAGGFVLSAYALLVMSNIDLEVSFATLTMWRVLQASALALFFVPITTSMYVGMPQEKNEEAAALFNLSRNLGGSVGISVIESLLARRQQMHQDVLVGHATRLSPAFRAAVAAMREKFRHEGLSPTGALHTAYAYVYQQLQRQASALAYVDVFRLLVVGAILGAFIALLLRSNVPGQGTAAVA